MWGRKGGAKSAVWEPVCHRAVGCAHARDDGFGAGGRKGKEARELLLCPEGLGSLRNFSFVWDVCYAPPSRAVVMRC